MFFLKRSLLAVLVSLSVVLSSAPQVGTDIHAQEFISYISGLVSGPVVNLDEAESYCSKALGFLDRMTDFMTGATHRCRLSSSVLRLNCVFDLELTRQMYDSLIPLVSARENYINNLLQQAAIQEQIGLLALEVAHNQVLGLIPADRWDFRASRGIVQCSRATRVL